MQGSFAPYSFISFVTIIVLVDCSFTVSALEDIYIIYNLFYLSTRFHRHHDGGLSCL